MEFERALCGMFFPRRQELICVEYEDIVRKNMSAKVQLEASILGSDLHLFSRFQRETQDFQFHGVDYNSLTHISSNYHRTRCTNKIHI